jgi:hypothetical protein
VIVSTIIQVASERPECFHHSSSDATASCALARSLSRARAHAISPIT